MYIGTLTTWKDEQGFGFATSDGHSERVFVHIKNFGYKTRRPVQGDRLVYDIAKDHQNRLQAINIQFLHDYERQRLRKARFDQQEENKSILSKIAAYPFILSLITLFFLQKIQLWVMVYYALISLITFIQYWQDKKAAQHNQRRTPENTLHNMSLLGGWMGALLAQLVLRHKSQKAQFRQTFWMTVIGNIIIFSILVYFGLTNIVISEKILNFSFNIN